MSSLSNRLARADDIEGTHMSLAFQRTGSADYPRYIKALLLGQPKSGKTTFIASAPNVLVADCEHEQGGLQSIAHLNVPYVQIRSLQDLERLAIILGDESFRAKAASDLGMPSIDTVAIDTIDALQQLLKAERLTAERRATFQRDDWGWLLDKMRDVIKKFVALPLNVILTCHTKTVEVDESFTVQQPALQGAIGEEVPGLVGYSLMSMREKGYDQQGNAFTKYYIQCEGDDRAPMLGNRAAGRLPKFAEPKFDVIYNAAFSGLDDLPQTEPVAAPEPADASDEGPNEDATEPQPTGRPPDDSDTTVTKVAIGHLTKLYEEFDLVLPPSAAQWTMGHARGIAKYMVACKADAAAGKLEDVKSSVVEYLKANDAYIDQDDPALDDRVPEGTVDEVLAWVGANQRRARAAFEAEVEGKSRSTLLTPLEQMLGITEQDKAPEPQPEPEPETEPEPDAAVPNPVVQQDQVSDDNTNGEAAVVEALDAVQVAGPCEECGKDVDDTDIATLAKTRFGKWLCVDDYMAATAAKKTA